VDRCFPRVKTRISSLLAVGHWMGSFPSVRPLLDLGAPRSERMWMPTLVAEALALALACQGDAKGPPVQTNPEVGESRHDSSPPLKDIPPAKRMPGKRVHPVRRIPRPPADGGPPPEEQK
jgi:hypothetical protein